jgi:hypothetical protein
MARCGSCFPRSARHLFRSSKRQGPNRARPSVCRVRHLISTQRVASTHLAPGRPADKRTLSSGPAIRAYGGRTAAMRADVITTSGCMRKGSNGSLTQRRRRGKRGRWPDPWVVRHTPMELIVFASLPGGWEEETTTAELARSPFQPYIRATPCPTTPASRSGAVRARRPFDFAPLAGTLYPLDLPSVNGVSPFRST